MTIHTLAAALRLLAWVGALLVLALPLLAWSGAPGSPLRAALAQSGVTQVAAAILLLAPYLAIAWGLVQISGFCRRILRGDHFTLAAAGALTRFGSAIIAASVLLPVGRIVITIAAGSDVAWWENLRILPLVAAGLGLIIGLIVIVFARLLEQATAIAEENASFL